MVVPFPAGGPTDIVGRIVAERMTGPLGQPVIIENVSGANGTIGVGRVARAAPDGYTICVGLWGTHVVNGAIYSLRYDLRTDFEPISLIVGNSRLNAAAADALDDATVRHRLTEINMELFPRDQWTPEALGTLVKAEIEKWWPIIKAANIKSE